MRSPCLFLVAVIGIFASLASSTALTYKLAAGEKSCFYAWVNGKGGQGRLLLRSEPASLCVPLQYMCLREPLQVQSGGSFDIDYSVVGPGDKVILDGSKERQGDFVFTATNEGEYRFCFDNDMSTVTDKMVDFEVTVGILTTVLKVRKTLIDLCNSGRERSPRYTSL